MKPTWMLRSIVGTCGLLTITALVLLGLFTRQAEAFEGESLQDVWARAIASGGYRFSADVVQKTIPVATTANMGRTSRERTFHLTGDVDPAAERLELTLQTGVGGPAAEATTIKIEGDQAYTRQGDGEWQETSDVTGAFAPQGRLSGLSRRHQRCC